MRGLAALLILAALAAGCSNRERANPLDPSNPATGGRPSGFDAVAGYSIVTLRWQPQPGLAVDGYRLERFAPGDSLWRPLGDVRPVTSTGTTDPGTTNGKTYRYRLGYVVNGATNGDWAEDVATPGLLRPWVADAGADALVRLSPDGRDIAYSITDVGGIQALAVDRGTGSVWTSAPFDGMVTRRFPGETSPTVMTGLHQPFTIAVSPYDHSAWICELDGSIAHRNPSGTVTSPGSIGLLASPTGAAVGAADFSLWACENAGHRVRHWAVDGTLLSTTYVGSPSRVAVDSSTRIAWVTSLSLGRVWRIAPDGTLLDSTGVAAGPIGIALDRAHGRAWVADAAGDRLIALDPDTAAELFRVTGLREPRDVDVDPLTGDAWVVARTDGEIVRVSKDGVVIARVGGFRDPVEVRIDPGTQ